MEALLTKLVIGASIGFQLIVLLLLLKRRLKRRFLWFLIYIAYELIELAVRLSAAGNKHLYFKVYWLTAIGGVIFSVMAVRESFLNVFWMYTRFRWFTRIVWGCVGIGLLYAAFRAWSSPPVHASRWGTVVVDLELAVDYSLGLVGILYFALVRFQKIREHQWESGIISGFMTIGVLSAVGALARFVFGPQGFTRWVAPVAYLLAELEWVFVLSRLEKEIPEWVRERELTVDDLTRLNEYSRVLGRILGRRQ
ncbi:MAG TPA: hypothetical protein VI636_19400 [Candidatus Angelobacter sp.]